MLQHFKKPTALVCALILCLSMLSGIVLPYVAETALAVADPYAQAHDQHATKLEVAEDGTVTPTEGVTVPVPNKYKGQDIFLPEGKLWFYNPNWTDAGAAGVVEEGDYLFAQYGDGVTWGNGKTYLLQWGITAFGGNNGNGAYSFPKMEEKISAVTPTVGGDNNYYIFCFPGKYDGNTSTKTHTLPSDDPEASDVNNVHLLGPQAGKSPVGPDAEAGIANGRGTDAGKEMILTGYYYPAQNVIYHWDGFALAEGYSMARPQPANGSTHPDWIGPNDGWWTRGVYFDNMYINPTAVAARTDQIAFVYGYHELWGSAANLTGHQNTATIFHMTNSYISGSTQNTSPWIIEANDLKISGCFFENVGMEPGKNTNFGSFQLGAGNKGVAYKKVLGDRTGWKVDITDNLFLNHRPWTAIQVASTDLYDFGTDAVVNFNNNRVVNFGTENGTATLFNIVNSNNQGTDFLKDLKHQATLSFCDNYISVNPKVTEARNLYIFNSGTIDAQTPYKIQGNTIVGGRNGTGTYYDFATANASVRDISGNLFLDHNNQVRVPTSSWLSNDYWNLYKVLSDIYASDEMAGGLKELFTITESPEDLFVAHSQVQTIVSGGDTANMGYIRGTLTVYPQNGVTYDTKNLFSFGNEEVKLVGVYTSEADAVAGRNKVSTLTKGFSSAGTTPYYVKAEYQAGTTTATVIYTMAEPTKFHVVVPSGATTYTFNGTTYTAGDTATFYTTLAAAVAGADADGGSYAYVGTGSPTVMTPLRGVIIVAPGTYADAMTMTRATAIIGPGFGKKASTQGALAAANGRGTNAATEAVITGITTLSMHGKANDLYVAMSGVSFNGQDFAFAYDYSGTVQANNQTKQRFAYLNLCDIYAAPGTALVRHGGFRTNGTQYWDDLSYINSTLFYVNVDNSYITQSAYSYGDPLFYGSFTGLNITDSTLNAANNPYAIIFKRVLSGTHFVTNPLRDYLTVDNCYVKSAAAATSRVFENVAEGHATAAPHGIEGTYAKGSITSLTNNIVEAEGFIYRIRPHGANTQHLVFTGNTVQRATNSATDVLGNYINTGVGAVASDAKLVTADISGNKIINSTKPWNITTHNSVDVNENYYGTSDGKAQAITAGEGSGYTIDHSWYYVNEACTVRSTDIALTKGGFNSITLDKPLYDYTATVTATVGETYTKSDFASAKGEVLSISTDPAGEKYVDSVAFDGTNKTVYVRVKYNNYIATWTVNITSDDVWVKYGLGLLDTDPGYVDLTSDAAYDDRTNARTEYPWLFIAPDWTAYAYTSYDAATGTLSGPINATDTPALMEETADAGDVKEMLVGTQFYAKMPTTGIVYKLTYGKTAANSAHAVTSALSTIVLFPGSYAGFNYGTNINTADNGYVVGYRSGSFALASEWESKSINGCNDYLILGPYAGITSANAKTGENTRAATWHNTEAVLSTNSYMYVMSELAQNGDSTLTIDGLAMWFGFHISTYAGANADKFTSEKNTVTINFLNNRVTNMAPYQQFFGIYGYGGDVGTNSSKNTMAANVRLNIKNSYFGSNDDTNAHLGRVNANEVNIDSCVIDGTKGSTKGFMINPTTAAKNNIAHTLQYTCNNSYIALPNSNLFNIEYAGTSGLPGSVVTGITVEAKNNTFVNCAQAADKTNGSIIVMNNATAELNAKTSVTFTGNKVINNTGADVAYGRVVSGSNNSAYKSINISKNEFVGYRNLFSTLGTTADFTDNLCYDHNGKFISVGNRSGVVHDIILSATYDRRASDFVMTAGLLTNAKLSWTPGYNDVTGNATHKFITGMTAAAVLDGVTFASDKVEAVALYTEDGTLLKDTDTVAADSNYRLTAAYKDDPQLITVLYYVTTEKDLTSVDAYNGTEIFWDPRVDGLADGTNVVRNVGGKDYAFTVGKNILASLDDFPTTKTPIDFKFDASYYLAAEANATYLDRHVYLLPTGANDGLEYTGSHRYDADSLSRKHVRTFFHGPFAGQSAVTLENGVPTDVQARTDRAAEAIMKNFTFALGNQAGVIFDGVTFAGVNRITDDSGGAWVPGTAQVSMLNCNSFAEEPLQFNSGDSMFNVTSNFNREGKLLNNYLILDEEQANNQYLFNGAVLAKFEMGYNYISSNEHAQLVWLNTTYSEWESRMAPYHNEMDVDIYNNRLNGVISINRLFVGDLDGAYQDATFDQNFITDIKINGNVWDQKTYAAINFEGYTGNDTHGYVQFANTSIAIEGNTFNSDGTPFTHLNKTAIRVKGNRTEGEAQFKKFNIAGNTFNNNADNPYSYAFNNMSDTVLDASGNTFVDFIYNYGNSAYMTGSAAFDYGAYYAPHAEVEYDGPRAQNVTLAGATFKVGEETLVSDANGVTVATVASSGSELAVEDGTIYDIAAAGDRGTLTNGAAYLFNPVQGMMVKATTADGKVYYNAVPLGAANELTFTAELCTLDGTVVEESAMTVASYREPIDVVAENEKCKVTTDGNTATFYWQAKFAANHDSYIVDLINNSGFKITDYGIYHAENEELISDVALQKELDASVTKTSYIGGANEAGLDDVKLHYSMSYQDNIEITESTTRYAKFYMTYKVGNRTYTVFSDTVSLTRHVAN